MIQSKNSWLGRLYYDIGKQQTDFRLTSTFKDPTTGENKFTKWVHYLEAQSNNTIIERANQREQLKNEIVFDLDKGGWEEYLQLIKKLKEEDIKFYAYATNEHRARHIHTFWKSLSALTKTERENLRRIIIQRYNCDTNLAGDSHVIPIEYATHWKTNQLKELVEENPGFNDATPIIEQIQKEKQERLKTKIIFSGDDSDVLTMLARRQREQATEKMAADFENREHIRAIRNDEKRELWIYREGIYIPDGASYLQEHCRKACGDAFTTDIFHDVLAKITADNFIDSDNFFLKDEAINDIVPVQNGLLNLKEKKLEPFTPNKIFFDKLPITYEPTATCPNIKKFFTDVLKNGEEEYELIAELFGWLLKGRYYPAKIVVCDGIGRNGKGVFFRLIKAFLGEKTCAAIRFETLTKDNFASSELFGKRANLFSDSGGNYVKDTSILKSLSGDDKTTAPRKFKTGIQFTNRAKLFFAFNEIPAVNDTSFGYWNRQLYLSFPYRFLTEKEKNALPKEDDKSLVKEANQNIEQEITSPEELSGLLNWAVEGYERIQKNGTFSYSLTTAEVQKIVTRKSNSFAAFFKERVEIDPDAEISKQELRKLYVEYCGNYKVRTTNDLVIKNFMEDQGLSSRQEKSDGKRYWVGIKPLEPSNKGNNGNIGLAKVIALPSRGRISKSMLPLLPPVTAYMNLPTYPSFDGPLSVPHGQNEGVNTACVMCSLQRCFYIHRVTGKPYCPGCAESVEKNWEVAR